MTIRRNTLLPDGFGTYDIDPIAGTWNRVLDEDAPLLTPGFVDLHVHGGYGIDFMDASTEQIERWCGNLADSGYEGFLPTTVTAAPADIQNALAKLPENDMILGFHLEGPFISPKYPGAQPKEFIVEPSSEWDAILDDPRLRYITIAPEIPNALPTISRLAQKGVVVSMGHTNASYAEAMAGFEAGARHTTHTYNAMRPLHHREAGTVGFALNQEGLTCELIYDRLHVSPEAASILVKCKSEDRLVAVSDGTFAIGMPPGQVIRMWNLECVIGKGQVRLKDGTLAGSAITLLDAFRNLTDDFGPATAIRACSLNPRRALSMNHPPKVWVEFDRKLGVTEIYRTANEA